MAKEKEEMVDDEGERKGGDGRCCEYVISENEDNTHQEWITAITIYI